MIPSSAVRTIAEETLGAHLRSTGYRRTPGRGPGNWTRPVGLPRLVGISFSKWNGTLPTGDLRVEVGAGRSPDHPGIPSFPITVVLDLGARTVAASLHDIVMHKARKAAPDVDPRHLASMDEPYSDKGDAWFPYLDEEDVRDWMRFIIDRLELAFVRLEQIGREAWPDLNVAPSDSLEP